MQIGMTLPIMEPDVDRTTLEKWACAVDQGPFGSLCFGERMAFDNPETMTLLGACAAWTQRVRLKTTVIVAQLHDPVMLAKSLATGDMLSRGRLTVGLGIGGRIAIMKRVWAGEKVVSTLQPIGPVPWHQGGPELLAGAQGPRAVHAAAQWADGISGFSFDLNMENVATAFDQARAAWRDRGRPEPRLTTSFWFAIGDRSRAQVQRHLRHYFNWIEPAALEAMLPVTGFAGTLAQLKRVLDQLEDLGADEVHLIPTSDDVDQVARIADLIA